MTAARLWCDLWLAEERRSRLTLQKLPATDPRRRVIWARARFVREAVGRRYGYLDIGAFAKDAKVGKYRVSDVMYATLGGGYNALVDDKQKDKLKVVPEDRAYRVEHLELFATLFEQAPAFGYMLQLADDFIRTEWEAATGEVLPRTRGLPAAPIAADVPRLRAFTSAASLRRWMLDAAKYGRTIHTRAYGASPHPWLLVYDDDDQAKGSDRVEPLDMYAVELPTKTSARDVSAWWSERFEFHEANWERDRLRADDELGKFPTGSAFS